MADYRLENGEYVVATLASVSVEPGGSNADLVLTNRSLIVVNKSAFGRAKGSTVYQLTDISVINGQANICLEKHDSFRYLYIQMKTGTRLKVMQSSMGDGMRCPEFAGHINYVLTGVQTIPEEAGRTTADQVAQTFQAAFAAFDPRTYLGGRKNKGAVPPATPVAQTPRHISMRCNGCKAPISGYVGQLVTCEYCDTETRLQEVAHGNR